MIARDILIAAGVVGAAIDILLHFLQLIGKGVSARIVEIITLVGCALMALSLIPSFNLGLLVMQVFVAGMAVFALVTSGKEPN